MQHIGRYRILGELGRGAMGVVYGALDPTIGRHVAIKTIRLSDITDLQERKRLQDRLTREAQSAGILSHPGIVTVYDIGHEDELAYIAMEFVNGPTLDKLLSSQKAMDSERVLDILHQTAAALDYAHKKGIVHRDIKPANVMIHDDGTAKITDFGVAKISASEGMTQAGTVLGTPNYMAPEQVQGKVVDGRADQFSLAVIAYEMLTGEKPFAAEQLPTILYKIVSEPPAPPQNLNPSLGWAVSVVLNKALSKDPNLRYQTASDFVDALESALKNSKGWKPVPRGAAQNLPTMTIPAAGRPGPMAARRQAALDEDRKPRKRKSRFAVALLLTALAAVGTAAVFFFNAEQWFLAETGLEQLVNQGSPGTEDAHPVGRPAPMSTPEARPPETQDAAGQTGTHSVEPVPQEGESATSPGEPAPTNPEPAKPAEMRADAEAGTESPKTPQTVDTASQTPRPRRQAIAAKPAPAPEPDQSVQIITSPAGAAVTIDDRQNCTSPCTLMLGTGRHSLHVTMPGHKSEMRIFDVGAEPRELFIGLAEAAGMVRIESEPPGAQIILNHQPRPERTPATLSIPPGKYTVTVARDGRTAEQEFTVKEGSLIKINFALNP